MRLIDADVLIERIAVEADEISTDNIHDVGMHNGLNLAKAMVMNEPTIDAEHVVHSHWEVAIGYDSNKKVQCQNCFLMAHEPTSRCPHCGAHMDEEVDYGKDG